MRALGSQAQECLESCHGCLSAVETKDEFIEIILQVFCSDTVMSAVEPGLQITEYPMNVQGVGFGMVELVMIPSHCVCGIPFPLIGIPVTSGARGYAHVPILRREDVARTSHSRPDESLGAGRPGTARWR
jgi:hypothetical protein